MAAYNTCTWRGIAFQAYEVSFSVGREVAIHQFYGGENPFLEDTGATPRVRRLRGFVDVSQDFSNQASIMAAFQTPGMGTLVTPTGQTVQAMLRAGSSNNTRDSVSTCEIECEFVETGSAQYGGPTIGANTQNALSQAAALAPQDFSTDFIHNITSTVGSAAHVVNSVVQQTSSIITTVQMGIQDAARAVSTVSGLENVVTGQGYTVSRFSRSNAPGTLNLLSSVQQGSNALLSPIQAISQGTALLQGTATTARAAVTAASSAVTSVVSLL